MLRRAEVVKVNPNVFLDRRRVCMWCLGGRTDGTRRVTEDAVERVFRGGLFAPDAVARRIVHRHNAAIGIMTLVCVRHRRRHRQREERRKCYARDRSSPDTKPRQHLLSSVAT